MGKLYWSIAAAGLGVAAIGLSTALAEGEEAVLTAEVAVPGVEACLDAISERVGEPVIGREVLRSWAGPKGRVVSLTVFTEDRDGVRRRDYTCRQGRYGLHLARA